MMVNLLRDLLFAVCFLAGYSALVAGVYFLLRAIAVAFRRRVGRTGGWYGSQAGRCAAAIIALSGIGFVFGPGECERMFGFMDLICVLTALGALLACLHFLWRCLETLVQGPEEDGRDASHYAFLTIYSIVILLLSGFPAFVLTLSLAVRSLAPFCC
jgi:hypothetical protein